LKIHSFRFLF